MNKVQWQANVRRIKAQISQESRLSETQTQALRVQMRRQAATLIEAVLDETLAPQGAINRWPDHPLVEDPSLAAALQALLYFEADETLQQSEVFYLDTQLELLRQIWRCLEKGRDLPPHIIRNYKPEQPVRYYYHTRTPWESAFSDLSCAWKGLCRTFQDSLYLLLIRRRG